MTNILDNLFYRENLGISNKTTFIKILERHTQSDPDIRKIYKNIYIPGSKPD